VHVGDVLVQHIKCINGLNTALDKVRRIKGEAQPGRKLLHQRLGLPVFLANDADCAALGEVTSGAAKGRHSALLVTLGTGIGAGFVVNGSIWSGYRNQGGEFGHMCICMDGALCSCGERGCWEAYASAIRYDPPQLLADSGAVDRLFIFDNRNLQTAEESLARLLKILKEGRS